MGCVSGDSLVAVICPRKITVPGSARLIIRSRKLELRGPCKLVRTHIWLNPC